MYSPIVIKGFRSCEKNCLFIIDVPNNNGGIITFDAELKDGSFGFLHHSR